MAVRVYTAPKTITTTTGVYEDYPEATAYQVDSEHELDILTTSGTMLATYAPGSWHHVEMRKG